MELKFCMMIYCFAGGMNIFKWSSKKRPKEEGKFNNALIVIQK